MAADIVPFPPRGSNDNQFDPTPPQPGLRSFIVYDDLPEGCIAFEVPNEQSAPHVHAGEFVVIDTTDREPMPGELFLCAFKSFYPDERRFKIMECDKLGRWVPDTYLISEVQPQSLFSVTGERLRERVKFMDGPYPPDYLRDTLFRGKVVGIYQPDFRPMLVAA